MVDYNFVRKTINDLNKEFNIKEIGVDRWNATQLITDSRAMVSPCIPSAWALRTASPGMKELYKLCWKARSSTAAIRCSAGWQAMWLRLMRQRTSSHKKKSTEKIDGIVAWIAAGPGDPPSSRAVCMTTRIMDCGYSENGGIKDGLERMVWFQQAEGCS